MRNWEGKKVVDVVLLVSLREAKRLKEKKRKKEEFEMSLLVVRFFLRMILKIEPRRHGIHGMNSLQSELRDFRASVAT